MDCDVPWGRLSRRRGSMESDQRVRSGRNERQAGPRMNNRLFLDALLWMARSGGRVFQSFGRLFALRGRCQFDAHYVLLCLAPIARRETKRIGGSSVPPVGFLATRPGLESRPGR
jgi:hypothetical protein